MTDIRINNNRFARDVVIFRTQARKGRGGFPCQRPGIQAQGGSVAVLVHTARTQGEAEKPPSSESQGGSQGAGQGTQRDGKSSPRGSGRDRRTHA